MNYLTLSPEEIRTRFGSHFNVLSEGDSDTLKLNNRYFSEKLNRSSCFSLPCIDKEVLTRLFRVYGVATESITEEVGEKDRLNEWNHQFENETKARESLGFKIVSAIEDAQKNLIAHPKMYAFFKFLNKNHLTWGNVKKNCDDLEAFLGMVKEANLLFFPLKVSYLTERKIPDTVPNVDDEYWVTYVCDKPLPSIALCKVEEVNVYDFGSDDNGTKDALRVVVNFVSVDGTTRGYTVENGWTYGDRDVRVIYGKYDNPDEATCVAYKDKSKAIAKVKAHAEATIASLQNLINSGDYVYWGIEENKG
jgi:hypothetical protein